MPGPSLQDMVNYSVNRAGQWERIKQGLYDTNLYPTAGQTQLNFFSAPVGFGTSVQQGNAASTKSIQDTNMTLAGQIPASQNVLIETIEVNVLPGSSAAAATFAMVNPVAFNAAASAGTVFAAASDAAAIYNSGALLLNVGSKNYLTEAPLSKFPPQTHLDVNAAVRQSCS
jgi:hypothetical protein